MKQNLIVRMAGATALMLTALCACTADEDMPDFNDGTIDNTALDKLTTESCSYSTVEFEEYCMDYESYIASSNEWRPAPPAFPGHQYDESFIMANGRYAWPLGLRNVAYGYSRLYTPWKIYCEQTDYDKTIYIGQKVSVDKQEPSIWFGELTEFDDLKYLYDGDGLAQRQLHHLSSVYIIHFASDKFLKLSRLGVRYSEDENHKPVDMTVYKYTYVYKKEKADKKMLKKMAVYDSELDAKLDMINMMRRYFGRTVDVNKYLDPKDRVAESIIDFDKLEQDIRGGRVH